jgi:Na+-transporting methylmalonyl-CoA/oxaloacetate decarboxylase beta subunit
MAAFCLMCVWIEDSLLFLFSFCLVSVMFVFSLMWTRPLMLALFVAADLGYVCVVLVFLFIHWRSKPCKIFRASGNALHIVMEIDRYLLVCR